MTGGSRLENCQCRQLVLGLRLYRGNDLSPIITWVFWETSDPSYLDNYSFADLTLGQHRFHGERLLTLAIKGEKEPLFSCSPGTRSRLVWGWVSLAFCWLLQLLFTGCIFFFDPLPVWVHCQKDGIRSTPPLGSHRKSSSPFPSAFPSLYTNFCLFVWSQAKWLG